MFFNSFEFLVFLPLVFLVYWFIVNKNLRLQNLFVVAASYLFYGWWDWRFLLLIFFSTLVDYIIGRFLAVVDCPRKRKFLLYISITVNVGLLAFFKYFNFFIDSFVTAFSFLGLNLHLNSLNIILPVGISFYTFQTLSYTLDVYRKKLQPTDDFVAFMAFVSFFPQLVAGPIERATNLLPQFLKEREFDYNQAALGMKQILAGFFKKVVIADNCAVLVDQIFKNYTDYPGSLLLLGLLFFAFQIYGDFSGYSDIAIGVSRLFGFKLMRNFACPYFSRDIAEFWRRWHISLSTWFRDYVYIPLGGNRGNLGQKIRNTLVVFLVSGFWHGANWTFIMWGLLNALYFLPLLLAKKNRQYLDIVAAGKLLPTVKEIFSIILTFLLTLLAWTFFRAESIGKAVNYLKIIFSKSLFSWNFPEMESFFGIREVLLFILVFIVIEWLTREKESALQIFDNQPLILRWCFYFIVLLSLFIFTSGQQAQFIYFQF